MEAVWQNELFSSYYPVETDLSINENESIAFGGSAADPDGLHLSSVKEFNMLALYSYSKSY